MNIHIENAEKTDRDEIYNFYLMTITDTFSKNNIEDPRGIKSEVKHQMKTFDSSDDLLMIARIDEKIVGTIAYGTLNKSVSSNIPEEYLGLKEIKSVYVHPDYQKKGIGSQLWKKMILKLKTLGIDKVCLDSGYKMSQQYWKKKIGEPTFFLKNYWGKGEHQLIWIFQISHIEY